MFLLFYWGNIAKTLGNSFYDQQLYNFSEKLKKNCSNKLFTRCTKVVFKSHISTWTNL